MIPLQNSYSEKTKTITFRGTPRIAAAPLGLLRRENASLRAQIAAQSLTALPPAAGEPAKSDRRGSFRVPRTEMLATHKAGTRAINWLSVLEDPDPVRRAGNFHVFVSNLTPENAQNAAESLLEMHQRNVLNDDEWKHFLRGWGDVDGKAALDFLEATPATPFLPVTPAQQDPGSLAYFLPVVAKKTEAIEEIDAERNAKAERWTTAALVSS